MTAKFDHEFSGISVWIEPDPTESSRLLSEMEYLRTKCGGNEAGLYPFVPHCTLLYNTSLPDNSVRVVVDGSQQTQQQQGKSLLRQCLEEYRKQMIHKFDDNHDEAQETLNNDINRQLQLIPTSHYYFPYPKSADNGKGFGCCISLLILETTPRLKLLHDVVQSKFPPDERHGNDASSSSSSDSNNNNTNEASEEGGPPRFRPHMALVYAPENQQNVVNGWLEKYTLQNEEEKLYEKWTLSRCNDQPALSDNDKEEQQRDVACWKAKYLSLWSTEGTLNEWYPICKLDLELEI